ncbi:MAG: NAD-dependent epimerase/dehydratase family protein [Imperialibacter sp.]
MGKTALIAGATGLVGTSLLDQLVGDDYYDKIVVLTRRELPSASSKVRAVITDFENLESLSADMQAQHFFCCLGTTLKKAGSKEAFFKVDYTYCFNLAQVAAKTATCEQFHVVTALGANAESVIYYNKVKGMLEDALKKLSLPSLYIYQPSLLLGERNERRPFEEIAKFFSNLFSFFMIGSSRKLFAIEASRVAKGMVVTAKKGLPGLHVFPSRQIEKITATKD